MLKSMRKYLFPLLTLAILMFGFTHGHARPCNQAELAAHKMSGSKGQCFRPDPHPLPQGIAWPDTKTPGDSYIYFINSSPQPIKVYTLAPEDEGEDPVAYHMTTLAAGTYTWDGLDSFGDYALVAGKSRADLDEEREYLKKDGPAIYKFYNIEVHNGKVQYRKITEAAAINMMKGMKYAKRKPSGEKLK